MKLLALLKRIHSAEKILVELQGKHDVLVQVFKKDMEEELMHVCNGEDVETGLQGQWSKTIKGTLTVTRDD